jgi:hypothetical protein
VKRVLRVTMPDDSKWDVPVEVIARNRAEHYADEFDGDVERSLAEDTLPLFEQEDYEIEDWAANNMNWSDVVGVAIRHSYPADPDYQEGWVNGVKEVVVIP